MIRSASLMCLAAATLAGGCGESPTVTAAPASTPSAQRTAAATRTAEPSPRPAARRGVTVRVVKSRYGTILANGVGKAFYLFDEERSPTSKCYGDCAAAWPPVLTTGRPAAGRGVRRGLIGTTRRHDGRLQVTYRGRPMYYYVADAPGRVLCQNVVEFGGRWLVVRPNGRPVT
jgi:predicted lipoprotein with Yx(FWY)xxD motif